MFISNAIHVGRTILRKVGILNNNFSLLFDGTNDYAHMPDGAGKNPFTDMNTGSWSFSFYVMLPAIASTQYVFFKGVSTDYLTIRVATGQAEIYGFAQGTPSQTYIQEKYDTALVANEWTHLTFTSDGSGGTRVNKCYKNGTEVTSVLSVSTPSATSISAHTTGRALDIASIELFPGFRIFSHMSIDEIAMWDKVLSSAEVLSIVNDKPLLSSDSGAYQGATNLKYYYRMEEGSGLIAASEGSITALMTLEPGVTFEATTPF